eukprot:scaffold295555_cov28-Tisochrysis_lutea.AAC.3
MSAVTTLTQTAARSEMGLKLAQRLRRFIVRSRRIVACAGREEMGRWSIAPSERSASDTTASSSHRMAR